MQQAAFLKKIFPFKSHYIDIAGFKMHYIDIGQGPVVLLLHGNPTWCFFYRQLIESLRDRFRVIAPDFIGCGFSDHPKDVHFRAGHRIQHLEEFVDKLALENFSLVMHDWGGSIGTGVAVRRIEAVEKLVYLNTTLTETEALPAIIKLASKPFIGRYLTQGSTRFLKLATKVGVSRKLSKDVQKAYLLPYKTKARRTAIWDFVADIPFDSRHPSYADMLFLADRIPQLANVPVQIVWGLKDPCFHREMLNRVAEHFPQARILEIPDASHLVLEDAPELANATIRSFLLGEHTESKAIKDSRATFGPSEDAKQNALYAAFVATAKKYRDSPAVIVPSFLGDNVKYSQINYGEFADLVNKYQRGLSKVGLERKDRVLMMVSPGIDFLALSLAVMGRGAIPFFLDPGMGKEKLFDCIKEIHPDIFIGSPKAQLLRLLKRKEKFSLIYVFML